MAGNTGWTGGPYGVGSRMKLKYTRAMISACIGRKLKDVEFEKHPIFNLMMPKSCSERSFGILNPKETWKNKKAYDIQAKELANSFKENFAKFESYKMMKFYPELPLQNTF